MNRNQQQSSGFSIVEVMVSFGIMSIGLLIFLTMIDTQNRLIESVSQKLTIRELQSELFSMTLNGGLCECLFRGHTLDTTALPIAWNTFPLSIPISFLQPPPPIPAPCVASGGNLVPPVGNALTNSKIKVQALTMTNIIALGGGAYSGSIAVNIDLTTSTLLLRPIMVPMRFTVNGLDPNNAKGLAACGVSGGGGACPVGMNLVG